MKIGDTSSSQTGSLLQPRVQSLSQREIDTLKKLPATVETKGIVYESTAIYSNKLSLHELQKEKIDVDTSTITRITSSDTLEEINRIVVIRDPQNTKQYVALELSKANISKLQQKFDQSENFFERNDGTLRLNGEAEAFLAGWLENIRTDRNYSKADADGNGLIQGEEAKMLTIGFARKTNYDYLGKKVTQIRLGMGETYQELGQTPDARSLFLSKEEQKTDSYKRSVTYAQYLSFENSVEKELNHTLETDTNLDGKITLDEGLQNEFGKVYSLDVVDSIGKFHKDLLEKYANLNDETRLQNYDLGLYGTLPKEEEHNSKNDILKTSAGLSTVDVLTRHHLQDSDVLMSLKELATDTTQQNDTKNNTPLS